MLNLEPVKIGSMTLQKADLTIGDFFGCWWKVRNGLSKVDTQLSKSIIDSMIKRQELMCNDIFASGIHFDLSIHFILLNIIYYSKWYFFFTFSYLYGPSFPSTTSSRIKNKAQNHICKLWNLICALKNNSGLQEEVQKT